MPPQMRPDIRLLIIVPARSGSKGITDKNVKPLAGKPLLQWTAETALAADLSDALAILSTDSIEYAEIGRRLGLQVPYLRPAQHAGDDASAMQVIRHALEWFCPVHGYLPELTMWLQPTSPFRPPSILRQAVELVDAVGADSVIGCKEIHRDLTTLFRREQGFMQAIDAQSPTQTGRQQSAPLLTPNGAMYLCKSAYLLEHGSFYPPRTAPLIMNAVQSLDIDTDEDWAIAEAYVMQGLI